MAPGMSMAKSFTPTTWGKIVSLEYGKALRDYRSSTGKVPVYGTNGAIGWTDAALCQSDGVIIGRKGAYRGVHYSPSPFFVIDTAFYLKPLVGVDVDMRWAYYQLLTTDINGMDSGSAIPSTSREDFYKLPVSVPHIEDQHRIADALQSFDNRIDLLRETNETLEATAQALFKSWFVDFDPVRAKAEGRDPGLPKPLTDLFPDSFEDSELGETPMGWQVISIGELAEVSGGGTPSTTESSYWNEGIHHWVTPKDLSNLSVPVLLDTERRITDAGLAKISSGLLPKGAVLLSSRAPIGYLAIAEIPVAINQGFIAMKAKPGISNLFLWLWASAAQEEIVSRANGSTFLEISKTNFRPIRLVTPSADVMHKFDHLARPLYKRIVECAHESRTLAAMRDSLLPKLISGEVQLRSTDKLIAEVV